MPAPSTNRLTLLKSIAALCLSLLFAFCANAETFVVTSNADSGPGTLRDALERAAANGTDETDYIHFNLPGSSIAARTITLLSGLPMVSSNLVIDATTQPGLPFGDSDARVKLTVDRISFTALLINENGAETYPPAGFFLMDVQDISIFGFHFTDFYYLTASYGFRVPSSAIYIKGSERIVIGAPGKGNAIHANDQGITIMHWLNDEFELMRAAKDIRIQSNTFFIDPLGGQTQVGFVAEAIWATCEDLYIGGNQMDEGNKFGASVKMYAQGFLFNNNHFIPQSNSGGIVMDGSSHGELRNNDFGGYYIQGHLVETEVGIYGNDNIASISFIYNNKEPAENTVYIGSDDVLDMNTFTPPYHGNPVAANAQVRKNKFVCSYPAYWYWSESETQPVIEVKVNTAAEFSGTATPLADIYIYEDNSDCEMCSPLVFLQKVTADPNGNWGITGDFTDKRMLANAVLGNVSSPFTQIWFNFSYENPYNYQAVSADCNNENGSIELFNYIHVLQIDWYDEAGNKIGEGPRLEGLSEGIYTAVLRNGNCSRTEEYHVMQATWGFYDEAMVLHHASCGDNASVTDLTPYSFYHEIIKREWRDAAGNVVDTTGYLENVGPGTYTLYIYISETCFKTYEVTLERMDGPTVDLSAMVTTPITCAGPGGVSGIRITSQAAIEYHWLDEAGSRVGSNSANLSNITTPGTYRLALLGDAACDTVWAATVQIREEGILRMDESGAQVTPAGCDGTTLGSIRGLQATNASIYQWVDDANRIVGNALALVDIPVGRYRLRAGNANGCEVYSAWYEVTQLDPVAFPAYAVVQEAPNCNRDNGQLAVDYGGSTIRPAAQRWTDYLGNDLGYGQQISALAPGTYHLYFTDHNGCETLYQSVVLQAVPPLELDITAVEVLHVTCASPNGQISNVQVSGGVAPYRFTWYDQHGVAVSESEVLQGVAAGYYSVSVTDAKGCNAAIGIIEINTSSGDDLSIPNTFSPNGDGINDTWLPMGIARYTRASVMVFDRNGQQVYRMADVQQPFDGRYRGADLPVGAYYYIIDLGNACPPMRGSLNLLR